MKVAVLISGRGSNLQALLSACRVDSFPAEIVLVISNKADAGGLDYAREQGVPTLVLDHRACRTPDGKTDRVAFDRAMTVALEQSGVEFICLAGFMRLFSPDFVQQWHNRLINIHPSLLPLFPGLETHQRALDAGCQIHGCTVHFVRQDLDSGPMIAQAAVPVHGDDDAQSLACRVLAAEHRLYPECLKKIADGSISVQGDKIHRRQQTCGTQVLLSL